MTRLARTPSEISSELERIICEHCEIPEGYVIVDLVAAATELSESRFKELDIVFIEKSNRTIRLSEIDKPFAEYIQHAQPSRSILSVYVPETFRDRCSDVLPALFSRLSDGGRNG